MPVTPEVQKFHDDALVFLAYTVTPTRLTGKGATLSHMSQWLDGPKVDLPKLKQGGIDAVFLSVGSDSIMTPAAKGSALRADTPITEFYMRPIFTGPAEIKRVLWGIDSLHQMIAENNDVIELALNADDVERIVAKGKIAGILHLTRGAIDNDLAALRTYYRSGVRSIQVAYDDGNPTWIDSCHNPPQANGLSDFGRDVILEMNRLGIIVDLAHASDKAQADVLAVSQKPVLNSHSGARAICNVWRNLTDETMHNMAAHGAMLGAFFGSGYLDENYWKQEEAYIFRKKGRERQLEIGAQYPDDPFALALALRNAPARTEGENIPLPKTSPMSILLEHIDYCINIVGEDNYCLGSDFGGIDSDGVQGLDEPSKTANLTAALLDHGYSKETTRKILGTNLLRYFRDVSG